MYTPKVNPLSAGLREKIKKTNWEKVTPMLIGFDVYVDVDGNVGFYEGNSIPHAIDDYSRMYGPHFDMEIANVLSGRGRIGINVDPRLDTLQMAEGLRHAKEICNLNGLDVVSDSRFNLRWDNSKDKFYFQRDSEREYFDFLFNRHVKANPLLRQIVPKEKWAAAPILNKIWHSYILGSKARTSNALNRFGLESPLAFVVRNNEEADEAVEKIMQHIEEEHENYQSPYILVKPCGSEGGKGIHVFKGKEEFNKSRSRLIYPYLVGERISAQKYSGHSIDMRIFYCNGKSSKAIGCVAPTKSSVNTNLCQGGFTTSVSTEAENILGEYVLAAALAVNERAMQVGLAEAVQ